MYYSKITVFLTVLATIVINFSSCTHETGAGNDLSGTKSELDVSKTEIETDFFYTEQGEKESFRIRKDKVIIKTKSNIEAKALLVRELFISAYDVDYIWVIATIDPKKTSLDDVLKEQEVIDATYALEYKDGTLQYPSDRIAIVGKAMQSPEIILETAGLSKSVESIERLYSDSEIHLITVNENLRNILQTCRSMYELDMCKFVEPVFFREIKMDNTHYSDQWGLKNTGQYGGTPGIDIKAEQAWAITQGSSDIKIAVIDQGVDLTHPDLQANLLRGYDATSGAPGGANGSPYSDNAHGTACAGIVGAINNTIGVRGVASGCKIVPVRMGYDRYNNDITTTSDVWIANGIRYAWQTAQVDVLSCSWSSGSQSVTISNAVYDAVKKGRGGKGCVVVSSTGNGHNPTINYPAKSGTMVIAVGAIDNNGYRASFSNYGTDLDIVAPGVNIYTTDIEGNAGYALNDYSIFGGTSAACPHVSGVAALILSIDPSLTYRDVAYIIQRTANKQLPGYTFSAYGIEGTWNNQVGHGLLNAYAAISLSQSVAAGPILSLSGPTSVTASSNGYARATLNVSPANSSYTYLWSGVLYGQCAWALTASNSGYGATADIDFQISPRQVGTLVVTCKVFNGSTYVGLAGHYVNFSD